MALFLTEEEVKELLPMADAVAAVEARWRNWSTKEGGSGVEEGS
jgi:hypothetical protein